jgi:hypothetical protein
MDLHVQLTKSLIGAEKRTEQRVNSRCPIPPGNVRLSWYKLGQWVKSGSLLSATKERVWTGFPGPRTSGIRNFESPREVEAGRVEAPFRQVLNWR